MDFEQALRAGGTVQLKEGFDLNALGEASPMRDAFSSPTPPPKEGRKLRKLPGTPIIVPPTPSPTTMPASSARQPQPHPSPSPVVDSFYDTTDPDIQTKRRSMYRSGGTSSSPDLATLLRKAKAKGGIIPAQFKQEKSNEPPPPLPGASNLHPNRAFTGQRQRSTTASASTPSTPQMPGSARTELQHTPSRESNKEANSPDWVLTSHASQGSMKENGTVKARSTVRAKTTAFLGKMLGQGTVRERSRTDASLPSSPVQSGSLFSAFAPPVPAIPTSHQNTPSDAPIADVFSSSQGASDTAKPLPPILLPPGGDPDDSDDSVVMSSSPRRRRRPPSEQTVRRKRPDSSDAPTHAKRRSMSVGEVELKMAMAASSAATPLPGSPEKDEVGEQADTSLNGILSEFKGELSQLDPISSSSLDLRDPSTPSRRSPYARAQTDSVVLPYNSSEGSRARTSSASSMTNPMLSLQSTMLGVDASVISDLAGRAPRSSTDAPSPIVPPRSSSLTTPSRPRRGSNSASSPPVSALRHAPTLLKARNDQRLGGQGAGSSRDANRLRLQHRSTASSSEPSLISPGISPRIQSPTSFAASQQDLTDDQGRSPIRASHSPSRMDDADDMEARGKELAHKCWTEDEDFLAKEKIAEWLGGHGAINKVALRYYMDFFTFTGLRLDLAFRRLCAKLYLKAETQQVDRILEEFSRRYWECNPGSVLGSASVVHAVSYSLLLLNTDLHVAELASRMSRNQFVRNTLTAIQMQLQPSELTNLSNTDLTYDDCGFSRSQRSDTTDTTQSTITRPKRSGSVASTRSFSRDGVTASPAMSQAASSVTQVNSPVPTSSTNASTSSVQLGLVDSKTQNSSATSIVYSKNWENDMESLLKDMYNAVKSQQILQPLGSVPGGRSSTSSLSPGGSHTLLRNRSFRGPPDRMATMKRGSIRGLQTFLGAQNSATSPYSSNSSVDGRASPSPSFATSLHEGTPFLQPTLGFASNLSHTIIRETQEDDDRSVQSQDSNSTNISITDEELALLGAPWAKEGMLCRKQYWESTNKRAKDKGWLDVFVVIQKGELNMFTFGQGGGGGSGVVGGGNWLENADSVGTVHLAHSLAHALPPPGYNRQRPHCMVLTLSSGGVYFFQAGTEELVNEWVSTCNYWAARTSKEPLAGGVSNMEYGWSRVEDTAHVRSHSDNESMRDPEDAMSVRSGRSSRSRFGWRDGSATVRVGNSPWADRIFINEWKAPLPPVVSSVLDEESQLEALKRHVTSMKKDLQQHNELRQPMTALYQPRSSNATKALNNWEKKSQYLLTEIVKYESYIDSLQKAMSLRLKKRGEKALERALVVASPDDDLIANGKARWTGQPEEETIPEGDEPPVTPQPGQLNFGPQLHRRETAET